MAIPPKASGNMMSSLTGISANCVFDGASTNMSIMRGSSCERRSIIEGEGWERLSEFKLFFEALPFFPKLLDLFFFLGEDEALRG